MVGRGLLLALLKKQQQFLKDLNPNPINMLLNRDCFFPWRKSTAAHYIYSLLIYFYTSSPATRFSSRCRTKKGKSGSCLPSLSCCCCVHKRVKVGLRKVPLGISMLIAHSIVSSGSGKFWVFI